jgi:hypothetical protein
MTDGVDRREDILVRLEALAKGVEDIEWAGRNAILDDTSNVRRITVLEGEEIPTEGVAFGNRRASDKQQVLMIPEILIACGAKTREVGPDLNLIRRRLIKKVLLDETLLALTVNSRSIRYGGMNSDLAFLALMQGKMSIKFRILYTLDPTAL